MTISQKDLPWDYRCNDIFVILPNGSEYRLFAIETITCNEETCSEEDIIVTFSLPYMNKLFTDISQTEYVKENSFEFIWKKAIVPHLTQARFGTTFSLHRSYFSNPFCGNECEKGQSDNVLTIDTFRIMAKMAYLRKKREECSTEKQYYHIPNWRGKE